MIYLTTNSICWHERMQKTIGPTTDQINRYCPDCGASQVTFPTAEERSAAVASAIKKAKATTPQPVAAEVATAPKLLLERAAQMCEWYAEFIRDNVMSQDIERHPYLPELEGVAVDLRALAGTGSDESAKENGNGL